jgi:hypothetical protein
VKNTVSIGTNRTGLAMAPLARDDMIDFAKASADLAPPDVGGLMSVHRAYIEEADRNGSVPMPATLKGAAKTGMAKLSGKKPEVLIDKLGERLAFERAGTRLYEALILKCAALQDDATVGVAAAGTVVARAGAESGARGAAEQGGASIDLAVLKRFHDEEEAHFFLVNRALTALGADPTAMTPCADVAGVMAQGLMQTVTDPSTSLPQSLEAILTAELSDNAGWELLIELAERLGQDTMADEFRQALVDEQRHLATVKEWLRTAVLAEAT